MISKSRTLQFINQFIRIPAQSDRISELKVKAMKIYRVDTSLNGLKGPQARLFEIYQKIKLVSYKFLDLKNRMIRNTRSDGPKEKK